MKCDKKLILFWLLGLSALIIFELGACTYDKHSYENPNKLFHLVGKRVIWISLERMGKC